MARNKKVSKAKKRVRRPAGKKPGKQVKKKPKKTAGARKAGKKLAGLSPVLRNSEHLALNEWIYGLNMLSYMYKPRMFREAALIATRHWTTKMMDEKPAKSGLAAAKKFARMLEEEGFEDEKSLRLSKIKGGVKLEVIAPCHYGLACSWLLKKGIMPQCARGHTIACGLNAFPSHAYKVVLKKCDPKKKCITHFVRVR